MKKYLQLALLTCTGITSLQTVHAVKTGGKRSYAQAAANQQPQPSTLTQAARSIIAENSGVSDEQAAAAAALVAIATQEYMDAKPNGESFAITMPEPSAEDLSRTRMISEDARRTLQEAAALDEAERELKRKKDAKILELQASSREITEKFNMEQTLVTAKKDKLVGYQEEQQTLQQAAIAKRTEAATAADALRAAKAAAEIAALGAEAAERASEARKDYTLKRQDSLEVNLHRLGEFQEQLDQVTAKLAEYGIKAADLEQADASVVVAHDHKAQEVASSSSSNWLTYLLSFAKSSAPSDSSQS